MISRFVTATIMVLGLSQAAHATLFRGYCNASFGTAADVEWEIDLDTQDDQIVQNVHQLNGVSVELTIEPGAAAFADVMTVKVTSTSTEFQLISLLSPTGYGSVVYKGSLDGEKFALECVVDQVKDY